MSDLTPEALDDLIRRVTDPTDDCAHNWEPVADLLDDRRFLREAARSLTEERDRLARWKAEALPVMSGLDELGHALGIPLGQQITARESLDLALDLRNERDAARAEVTALRERIEALRITWTEATCQTDGAPCSWHRVSAECATELDAAMADPATNSQGGG